MADRYVTVTGERPTPGQTGAVALATAGSEVVISGATPPLPGQVLTADGTTSGSWKNGGAGGEIGVALPIELWTLGSTPPTASSVGTTPATPALRFDATAETVAISVVMPPDWDHGNVSLDISFALTTTETDTDTADLTLDYTASEEESTGAGPGRTSTQLTDSVEVTTAGGLASGDVYRASFSLDRFDSDNPLADAQTLTLEWHLTNVTDVEAIDFLGAVLRFRSVVRGASEGNVWLADVRPTTPHELDDEFDGNEISADWSILDNDALLAVSVSQGKLVLSKDTDGSPNIAGVYKAVPGVSDYQIVCKCLLVSTDGVSAVGLFLSEDLDANPTTADIYQVTLEVGGADINGYHRTAYNASTSALSGTNRTWNHPTIYMRFRVSGTGSTIAMDVSGDGQSWIEIDSRANPMGTIAHFGLFHDNRTGATRDVLFDWVRVVESSDIAERIGGYLPVSAPDIFIKRIPEIPPLSPEPENDDFSGDTLASKWTEWDHGSNHTLVVANNELRITDVGGGGNAWGGAYQPVPDTEFAVYAFCYPRLSPDVAAAAPFGIVIGQDLSVSTADIVALEFQHGNATDVQIRTWTAYNGTPGSVAALEHAVPFPGWQRVRVNGTSVACDFSTDGVHWVNIGSTTLSSIAHFAVASNQNTGTGVLAFKHVRVFSGAGSSGFDATSIGRDVELAVR